MPISSLVAKKVGVVGMIKNQSNMLSEFVRFVVQICVDLKSFRNPKIEFFLEHYCSIIFPCYAAHFAGHTPSDESAKKVGLFFI